MIGFKQTFAAMFKEKSRTTWLSLGIEAIFILLISLYFGIRYGFGSDSAGIGIGIAATVIFCVGIWYQIDVIMTAYRINRSQTWRQVPVTAGNFLTANVLTGLVTAVIFALANLLIFVITLLPFIFWRGDADRFASSGDFPALRLQHQQLAALHDLVCPGQLCRRHLLLAAHH